MICLNTVCQQEQGAVEMLVLSDFKTQNIPPVDWSYIFQLKDEMGRSTMLLQATIFNQIKWLYLFKCYLL